MTKTLKVRATSIWARTAQTTEKAVHQPAAIVKVAKPSEITIAADWGHLVIAYKLATVIRSSKDDRLL